MIPLAAVISILRDSDLHLSWLQQQAIAAQVNVDPSSGMVDVRSFIERASSLLYALQRVQVDTAFAQRLLEMRSSPVVVVNNGAATTDRPTFDNALLAVLSSLDKGNGKGEFGFWQIGCSKNAYPAIPSFICRPFFLSISFSPRRGRSRCTFWGRRGVTLPAE
jgi:hypothetical protein